MKKRFFAKRPKTLPKGYDSHLEFRLHETALKDCQHHVPKQDQISYTIPHDYEPDFIFQHELKMFVVECKGRFRERPEAAKYGWVRDYLKEWKLFKESECNDIELIIIFESASTPMPFSKARKDGTKQTHGDWASKNNFRWLCEKRGDLVGVDTRGELVGKLEELN